MDFSVITTDAHKMAMKLVNEILISGATPAQKLEAISNILTRTGAVLADKVYNAAAEVYAIDMIERFAEVESIALGAAKQLTRELAAPTTTAPAIDIIHTFFMNVEGVAQEAAFNNAISLEMHPQLTRTPTNKDCCQFCRDRQGTWTNPTSDLFRRHDRDGCIFEVSGYNTRNGRLKNFKKT